MPAADLLRTARHRAGLTQRQLAECTGIPQSSIARVESGAADMKVGTLEILLDGCSATLAAPPKPWPGQNADGVDLTLIQELLTQTPHHRVARLKSTVAGMRKIRQAFVDAQAAR